MRNSKRATRRHHYQRLKKSRAHYWGDFGEFKRDPNPVATGLKVSAPKTQSNCMCCMNQRKLLGETFQEQNAQLQLEEETNG